jgi:Zn-dependent protease with chaperone function
MDRADLSRIGRSLAREHAFGLKVVREHLAAAVAVCAAWVAEAFLGAPGGSAAVVWACSSAALLVRYVGVYRAEARYDGPPPSARSGLPDWVLDLVGVYAWKAGVPLPHVRAVDDERIGPAYVAPAGTICINPAYLVALPRDAVRGLVAHEIAHLARKDGPRDYWFLVMACQASLAASFAGPLGLIAFLVVPYAWAWKNRASEFGADRMAVRMAGGKEALVSTLGSFVFPKPETMPAMLSALRVRPSRDERLLAVGVSPSALATPTDWSPPAGRRAV